MKSIPLAVEFNYLATSAECAGPINRPFTVEGLDFMKKMIMMKSLFFAFLCIFGGFLNFWWCSIVESLQNRTTMPELPNWLASKAWQVL